MQWDGNSLAGLNLRMCALRDYRVKDQLPLCDDSLAALP